MNNKQISGKLYTHLDHMEKSIEVRITQKMEKRQGKLLLKNEEISGGKAHTETYLIYFDNHRCLSQSEESKCM